MSARNANDVLELARPELRSLVPYTPGAYEPDCIRLNANESPWRTPGDPTARGLNVYPPPRPWALRTRLAAQYSVAEEEILVTRGSSEAIDILIRGFCAARRDAVVVSPPTFDMYRVYAGIQGVDVIATPLLRDPVPERDFALDTDAVIGALDQNAKIVFICSPNNPTGTSMSGAAVETVCEAAEGRALVVIDEAYLEFADAPDFRDLQTRYQHVVLLRTLSKFVSLAGVRCGAVIATPKLIEFLGTVLPPYTFPTPSIELVLEAMSVDSLQVSEERNGLLRTERERMSTALIDVPGVTKVWPSDANFLLIEARDPREITELARAAGILVRTFGAQASLERCVRITVGRPEDNDLLLAALSGGGPRPSAQEEVPGGQ